MSNTIPCHCCLKKVNRGHAHIRSIAFEQIGWCRACWKHLSSDSESEESPAAA